METVVTSCKQICKSYQVDVSVEKTQQLKEKRKRIQKQAGNTCSG